MFGESLPPEADQQNFAYPAYAAIVLAPLSFLPAPIAIALWMSLQFTAVLWSILIWMRLLEWRPSILVTAFVIIGFLFILRYTMNLIILAQFTGTILLMLSLGCFLLLKSKHHAAGVLMALATIPPTISLPLSFGILSGYLLHGRWKGLVTFLSALCFLVIVSVLRIGWWINDFIEILTQYAQYARPLWPLAAIPISLFQVLFIGALAFLLLWTIWRFKDNPTKERQIDFFVIAFLCALLVLPKTGNYYLVLLIPPLLVCMHRARESRNRVIIWSLIGLSLFSPWCYWYFLGEASHLEALLLPTQVLFIWSVVIIPQWLQNRRLSTAAAD